MVGMEGAGLGGRGGGSKYQKCVYFYYYYYRYNFSQEYMFSSRFAVWWIWTAGLSVQSGVLVISGKGGLETSSRNGQGETWWLKHIPEKITTYTGARRRQLIWPMSMLRGHHERVGGP